MFNLILILEIFLSLTINDQVQVNNAELDEVDPVVLPYFKWDKIAHLKVSSKLYSTSDLTVLHRRGRSTFGRNTAILPHQLQDEQVRVFDQASALNFEISQFDNCVSFPKGLFMKKTTLARLLLVDFCCYFTLTS